MPVYCHIRLELDKTLAIPPGLATCRIQRRQGSQAKVQWQIS
jgi:hypothetical protein